MQVLTLDILAEKLRSIGVYGGNAEKLMPFLSKYLYTSLPPSRSQVVSLKHLAENFPELNMANYNPDDVEELNNWGIEIADCAEELAATLPTEQVPEADAGNPVSESATVSDEQIKAVFLANGFTIKEGMTDLKPYVYQAARALLDAKPNFIPHADAEDQDQDQDVLTMANALVAQRTTDALDAARYRFLRDTCWSSDKELATVISLQMNKVWDEKIDEAMARNKEE